MVHHQQIHQAEGEIFQPLALGKNIVGRLETGRTVHLAAAEHIRIADDGGERGFQLVDEAGGKILLPAGSVLQLLDSLFNGVRHVVEVRRQLADLVPAGHLRAGGVVPLGQLGRDLAQGADGHGEPVGEQEQHRAARRHDDQKNPAVDLEMNLPVRKEAGDIPHRLHIQDAVRQGHRPGEVDQHLPRPVGAHHIAVGTAVDAVQKLLVAAGGEGGVELRPFLCADPELPVREIGVLGERTLQAPASGGDILQGDASGVAHGLVGDAQHLHFLHGDVDLPLQGGPEGEGDEQIAAHAHGDDQDANGGQGDFPGKFHGSLTSKR